MGMVALLLLLFLAWSPWFNILKLFRVYAKEDIEDTQDLEAAVRPDQKSTDNQKTNCSHLRPG
jgi:hypothetical protein